MQKQRPKQHKRANGKGSVTMRKDANRAKPAMVRATVNGKQVYIRFISEMPNPTMTGF